MDLFINIRDTCSSCTIALPSFSHERKPDRTDETGGIKLFILTAILLATYAMYLNFYPYMYFDTSSKKMQGLVFQLPFINKEESISGTVYGSESPPCQK